MLGGGAGAFIGHKAGGGALRTIAGIVGGVVLANVVGDKAKKKHKKKSGEYENSSYGGSSYGGSTGALGGLYPGA